MASQPPDYEKDVEAFAEFFSTYQEDDDDGQLAYKYKNMLQRIANRETRVLEVDLDDVADQSEELADKVTRNTKRYLDLIAKAADKMMPERDVLGTPEPDDILDHMIEVRRQRRDAQRREGAADDGASSATPGPSDDTIPDSLFRRYQISILPRSSAKDVPMRRVLSASIGSLLSVKGLVTRSSTVRPQLDVATYTCDQCGFEVYQDITGRTFMPLHVCPSPHCEQNRTNGQLRLQTRGSKFSRWQELRVQEEADQVPVGHIPRAITVYAYGETAREASAGEVVTVTGVFLPVPFTGLRGLRTGLLADTYVHALSIHRHKKAQAEEHSGDETSAAVRELAAAGGTYERLARSIAPEIFAHDDVKKAPLLLLVGGCTKVVGDGMRIRGDINICLMGEPGVAKSQLLKHIAQVAPRAVYTTGKGSSGVGLTAAVVRDSATGEAVLEGGALVLADMGVCCIDEFDKMDETDRTAIHEVMEQQTVSIAKAGITTTLNARTSVLAAANPAWSRWHMGKSVTENVNLPAALLSRFDLMWLILDAPDPDRDRALAQHVTYVHRFQSHPPMEFEAVEARVLRAYVQEARAYEPSVPKELSEHIVDEYVALRQKDASDVGKSDGFTSARTLLATLRLAQALARLRLSNEVVEADVAEARRLMEMSKDSIEGEKGAKSNMSPQDRVNKVAELINDSIRAAGGTAVDLSDVMPRLVAIGMTQADVDRTLHEYTQELGVWQLNPAQTTIRLVPV